MLAHDLAKLLLSLPNVEVVTGLDRNGYGEPVVDANACSAHPFAISGFCEEREPVIELTLADESTYSSTPS